MSPTVGVSPPSLSAEHSSNRCAPDYQCLWVNTYLFLLYVWRMHMVVIFPKSFRIKSHSKYLRKRQLGPTQSSQRKLQAFCRQLERNPLLFTEVQIKLISSLWMWHALVAASRWQFRFSWVLIYIIVLYTYVRSQTWTACQTKWLLLKLRQIES